VIVLDTHVLVWWVSGDPALSRAARNVIQEQQLSGEIIISAISAWEIAMLVDRGRLVLSMDVDSWLSAVARIERMRFVAVDREIGVKSVTLPGDFHKDPADRMIVATCHVLSAPLVTADSKIQEYAHITTIW